MFIDTVFVVDGQLTADGWECWPHPAVNLRDSGFGIEDGEYPVELEMINNVPTRLIIHFDRQPDRSA